MIAFDKAIPAIEGLNVFKAFGAVQALDGASFQADFGEVHALVGENGAGKSTMIKILSGLIHPDSGVIRVRGQQVELSSPQAAQSLGIGTVFQELTLMPWMTVAENLLLRHEPRNGLGLIRRGQMGHHAEEILAGLGIEQIDPMELVANLSLAQQQIVEIAHAVIRDPDILFMDEPTSSLAEREVIWLFDLIKGLRQRGKCIIFTSHRWKEIESIADRITIFRNGVHVGTYTGLDEDQGITLMTGRKVDAMYPELAPRQSSKVVLEAKELTAPGVHGISFKLHQGEILGVGGLAGHGHRELFMTLFGVSKPTHGHILVDGKQVAIHSPRDAINAGLGIALIPEDRKREGLLLPMSVRDNLTLAILDRVSALGVVRQANEQRLAGDMVAKLQVRMGSPRRPVRTLSGGNQQKVLIGRWLLADSRVLLLYDITRGVDIATKHDIYDLMLQLIDEGRSIVFYSSDTEEIARLSHRVLVLREGRLSAELEGPGIDAEEIVAASIRENGTVKV
ncbi:MAG TPA: sugar ABC transporter ATP-binding protein [Chloroflexota bacterium]|nr:sugar ABC transporter ATP-binding protein [Chloroflexota bacterium]